MAQPDATTVYLWGLTLVHVCCCAPATLTGEEVAAAVNAKEPTGITSGWQVDTSPDPAGDGAPNPRPCPDAPGARLHYLMVC
jgi:hypothetical protein